VREIGVEERTRELQGVADQDERADALAARDRDRQVDEEPRIGNEIAQPGERPACAGRDLEGEVVLVEQAEIEQQLLRTLARTCAPRE
jgi:hypothetical protein